jgi:general secretion pathway protein E
MAAWLRESSGMPLAILSNWRTDAVDVALVPFAEGQRRLCAARKVTEGGVELVLADPFDNGTRLWLESRLRRTGQTRTHWCVATPDELMALFTRLEREMRALDAQVHELPAGAAQAERD